MNYEDVRTRYMADLNTISSPTTYSLEEAANEVARSWPFGGGGSDWTWSEISPSVTINTNSTINRDLWDSLVAGRNYSIEYVPINGLRAERITIDDSSWRIEPNPDFQVPVAIFEKDSPCEQIPDGDLEDIL